MDARYSIFREQILRRRLVECNLKPTRLNSDDWRDFYIKFTRCKKLLGGLTEGDAREKMMFNIPDG